ncbi:methyl-accepting chemotaxis protein [Desulfovirgula thermocuniculi]|uniref:methyl-accepting chemotaxis protein n=1 Tax=Desulfovirgula thermocuniculi TaxID=348842 RepID=UPI0006881A4E|nr:methyl-accepting chemotaxis protein [Desulfovirgula thermocuniculi]
MLQQGEQNGSIISWAIRLAPAIRKLLGDEVGIYISDTSHLLYCEHGIVPLPVKPGEVTPAGTVTAQAIRTKRRVSRRVGAEVLGVPYIGIAHPLLDPATGEAVGAITVTMPTAKQENLYEMAHRLESQAAALNGASATLSTSAEELANATTDLQNIAQSLQSEISRTDHILRLVREIAEKTHILGLNATIEAARLGNMGRAFNVVAREVRNLSQETQNSIKEISRELGSIKDFAQNLTSVITEVAAASQQLSALAQEIHASINELNAVVEALKKQADEMIEE